MTYEPHLIAIKLSYFLMVWFVFSFSFSNKNTVASSLIILVMWIFYSYLLFTGVFDPISYEQEREALIYIDGIFALLLSFAFFFDKNAWKYALTLCFAVLCHIMILLSLKNGSYGFFYNWYDELIIATQLTMMAVSYDGTIRTLRDIPFLLRWRSNNRDSFNKSLFKRKAQKGKS
jgi:hypothetical protein